MSNITILSIILIDINQWVLQGNRAGLCRRPAVGAVRGGRGKSWVFGKQNQGRHFPSRLPMVEEPDSCLYWGWWRIHAAQLQLRPGHPVPTTCARTFWIWRECICTRNPLFQMEPDGRGVDTWRHGAWCLHTLLQVILTIYIQLLWEPRILASPKNTVKKMCKKW